MKNDEENDLNEVWETPEITVLSINEETELSPGNENMDDFTENS